MSDVWMAELLGAQESSIVRCIIHRLDVRGADLRSVEFSDVRVYELIGDTFVRFGPSVPSVDTIVESDHFGESRWFGSPSDWLERRSSRPSGPDPDEKWYLLEKFARISMRQFAIRSGRVNEDPASRRILESPLWPELRELLVRHGRLEVLRKPDAAGLRSEWFHLVAGAEFLDFGTAKQESTRAILRELSLDIDIGC